MSKQKDGARKTNALRAVEAAGIEHRFITFECDQALSGLEVAETLGEDPDHVFKTLVTQAKSGAYYVFMIPVACELDLKKASAAVGEKAIAMINSRDLLPLTGYIHGGCSPIGMKTPFPTAIDETAQLFDTILFSGGRIGCQIEMKPEDLESLIGATFADLTI